MEKEKFNWKKEYFRIHKLMGNETTPLQQRGLYWNEAGTKLYLTLEKKVIEEGKEMHYQLGYISISTKQFLLSLFEATECMTWEDLKKEEIERRKEDTV